MGKIGFYTHEFENPLDGETLYCARHARYSELGTQDMIEYSAQNQRVDEQSMLTGMGALSDAIFNYVLNGHSVTIDGLGCFYLSAKTGLWDDKKKKWKSAGKTSMDDVSPADIKGVYVRFRPCTALREQLKKLKYEDITKTKFGGDLGGYDYTKVGKAEEPKP